MRTGPSDVIRVQDEFYILASSSRVDDRTRVLKHGETFAVFDRFGDISPVGVGELGLYHEGTRFLSQLSLRWGNVRPLLLGSTVKDDNTLLRVDLTNPDVVVGEQVIYPRGTIYILREKVLWEGACYERLRIANYGSRPAETQLVLYMDADFADVFEVRGMKRDARGYMLESVQGDSGIVFAYRGRDGVVRRTRVVCSPPPAEVSDSELRFPLVVSGKEATIHVTTTCEVGDVRPQVFSYDQVREQASVSVLAMRERDCGVYTSNEQFNDWISRSLSDLHMMVTETPQGMYPYAGVPWYSTVFGRDGIITALEMLWVNSAMARGVLGYLAATQATEVDDAHDAQPGKILHETRKGEMARLGEVPFGRYYGSVDATPLFVILAGAYHQRTGDTEFVRRIWPNVELALNWMDTDGDPDRDGFVEYYRHTPRGLAHQGWKDSQDSVFHADGTPAEGPIALCEVQGYVYQARCMAADLAEVFGESERAATLRRQAAALREKFEAAFWCEDLSTYALALDGAKRPCRVRTSNAGQCLYTGIVSPQRADRVLRTLLAPESFSGWGIRTVAAGQARYNPMSYHNGSVWPHDNAIIGAGFARYGLTDAVVRILAGLFDASLFVDLHRVPELLCGLDRRLGEGPTLYPVACSPQSWVAGAPFMLLQACLGLSIDAREGRVSFWRPFLPEFLTHVRITNLRVGDATADLALERYPEDVGINVLRRSGKVEVVVVK